MPRDVDVVLSVLREEERDSRTIYVPESTFQSDLVQGGVCVRVCVWCVCVCVCVRVPIMLLVLLRSLFSLFKLLHVRIKGK